MTNETFSFALQPAPQAPDDRATEFTAVDANAERYSGSTLMVEAYAAIWLILMIWIYMLWRKQASLAERLDDLERTIDRAAESAEKKAKAKAS
jgi:CcmD family protein